MKAAIERYHELLTPSVAEDSWNALGEASRAQNLAFGDRLICNVLRPYFISRDEEAALANASRLVVSALHAVFDAFSPAQYESVLGLSPVEAALATCEPRFAPVETMARLDSFWPRGGQLKFIEYNSESPGGIGFGAALARIFRDLPVMKEFEREYLLRTEPVLDHTLEALMNAYAAWGGTKQSPTIGIIDWRGARTYPEFVLCKIAFEHRGHRIVIADPDELEISDRKLMVGDERIDIVYRRVVASEVAARLPVDHPLIRAEREGAACVASGFRAFAILSKALFALVSDPSQSSRLTAAQRAAVDSYVPWTRLVRDARTTSWDGSAVDLLEFAATNRRELVVKPATDYGGSGVHLGWTESQEDWDSALRGALERPSVIQRRVEIPSEDFPVMEDGSLQLKAFMADVDPYVFAGQTGKGQGTRLSSSDLLNVSAGGGSAVPVFVVERS